MTEKAVSLAQWSIYHGAKPSHKATVILYNVTISYIIIVLTF